MIRPVGNDTTTTGNVVRAAVALTAVALIAAGILTILGAQIQGSKFAVMSNAMGGKDIATGLGSGAIALGALLVTGVAINTFYYDRTKKTELQKAAKNLEAAVTSSEETTQEVATATRRLLVLEAMYKGQLETGVDNIDLELVIAEQKEKVDELKAAEKKAKAKLKVKFESLAKAEIEITKAKTLTARKKNEAEAEAFAQTRANTPFVAAAADPTFSPADYV
jgi:hypothetical protein